MTSTTPASSDQPPKKKRFGCFTVLLVLAGLVCVTLATMYWLVMSEPVYWQQRREFIESHSQDQLLLMAESVEQRLLASISGPTTIPDSPGSEAPPATRTVSLSIDEVNAWMNQRLDGWLNHQGKEMPPGVENPMLAVESSQLVAAFRYQKGSFSSIVSLKFTIELHESEDAVLQLVQIQAGRMPAPRGMAKKMMGQIGSSSGESSQDKLDQLAEAFDGASFDPVLNLDNDKIRLVAIDLKPGGIDLTIRPQ